MTSKSRYEFIGALARHSPLVQLGWRRGLSSSAKVTDDRSVPRVSPSPYSNLRYVVLLEDEETLPGGDELVDFPPAGHCTYWPCIG